MIDTYVTILKSYADRAVPDPSLNALSRIYEDGVIDLWTLPSRALLRVVIDVS